MTEKPAEDDKGGEQDLVSVADKPRVPTAYEIELRRENAARRKALSDLEAKAADDLKKAGEEHTKALDAATKAGNERYLRAELKAEAIKAGLADMEFLKLMDLSKIKLNEAGEVEGADAFFEKAKKDKPGWFADKSTTSSTGGTPDPTDGKKKHARDMTPAEYAAAKAKLLGQ